MGTGRWLINYPPSSPDGGGAGTGVSMKDKIGVGDVVQMRKGHPCGGDRWEVLRVGMDFRIKCLGCGRVVMLPHRQFMKQVKTVVSRGSGPV